MIFLVDRFPKVVVMGLVMLGSAYYHAIGETLCFRFHHGSMKWILTHYIQDERVSRRPYLGPTEINGLKEVQRKPDINEGKNFTIDNEDLGIYLLA